jgi:diguanylate cyclase (GGDEF)-like protein
MPIKIGSIKIPRQDRKRLKFGQVSLLRMLTLPFILQVVTVVGLVGYLSYLNGQRSVEDLTNQLMDAASKRIEQKLTSYLGSAHLANQINSNAVLRGDLKLDFNRPDPQREQYFWQHMQLFGNLAWISVGAESDGSSIGIWRPGENQNLQFSFANKSTQYYGTYYATNEQGIHTTKLKVERPVFDARTRPWYKEAIAAKQAIWTSIYAGFTSGTVFIAASQPLYDEKGTLVGVSGSDISLLGIQTFLAQNPVSPSSQIFIIERSGLLVASSSQESPFRIVNEGKQPQRVNVLDSQTPSIRATAQFLQQKFGRFENIRQPEKLYSTWQDRGQFIRVVPFSQKQGLDWQIAIVVPESDVMEQIHAGTQTTIWLCLAALIVVIGLNILMSRWLARPIIALSQASQGITKGDFSSQIGSHKISELSVLSDSFKKMSQEILRSRQQLEDYSRSLEEKVSDRTQALQAEIERRSTAEIALQSANVELQRLAYLDGLTQIANRRRFDEVLIQEWYRLKRDRLSLSLVICDIDYFKQYNDTYGHIAGDECLRQVASAIASAARRSSDLAARYGGEEFLLLLPNTPINGAIEVVSEIRSRIKSLQLPHQRSQVSQFVTLSLGIASMIPSEATIPQELLSKADRALYQAKTEGRDRYIVDSKPVPYNAS